MKSCSIAASEQERGDRRKVTRDGTHACEAWRPGFLAAPRFRWSTYGYAQWPSSQAREQAFALGSVDPIAGKQMREAIAESLAEIVLEPVSDFLVAPTRNGTWPLHRALCLLVDA